MARKHSKKYSQKQPVRKVVLKPAITSKEREAVEVSEGTEGAIPVKQDDGSVKYFVVQFKVVQPEVSKLVACGPTNTYGKPNKGGA